MFSKSYSLFLISNSIAFVIVIVMLMIVHYMWEGFFLLEIDLIVIRFISFFITFLLLVLYDMLMSLTYYSFILLFVHFSTLLLLLVDLYVAILLMIIFVIYHSHRLIFSHELKCLFSILLGGSWLRTVILVGSLLGEARFNTCCCSATLLLLLEASFAFHLHCSLFDAQGLICTRWAFVSHFVVQNSFYFMVSGSFFLCLSWIIYYFWIKSAIN